MVDKIKNVECSVLKKYRVKGWKGELLFVWNNILQMLS